MNNPLSRVPWFVFAPAFLGAVIVASFVANYLGADYFKRTRLDEANPLLGAQGQGGGAGQLLASGSFRDADSAHRGSGEAKVLRDAAGKLVLRLENFSVTNGPDLFVVLSTSADGYAEEGALNLGDLKATDGNFNYDVPEGTDLTPFESVIIWCRQFDVTFAVAELTFDDRDSPVVQAPSTTPGAPSASATSPPGNAPAATAAPTGPVVLATGMFRDGEPGHRGSGTATLGRDAAGKPVLVLENFSVTNGPDLHVILGSDPDGGGEGLDLGELKATDGTFSYEVPLNADLASFRSVTIWCASFPTIFAVATFGG